MIRKLFDWLQKNWILVTLILVLIVLLRVRGTNNRQYKRDISDLNDSIEQLDKQYQLMEESLSTSQELTRQALNMANVYYDSLKDKQKENINLKRKHEIEIKNLKNIPTDTLYLDYIRWIDSISFE